MSRDIPFFEMFTELQLSGALRLRLAGAVLRGASIDRAALTMALELRTEQPLEEADEETWSKAEAVFLCAVEQLVAWGERADVPVIKQKMGSDPASVAFDAVSSAKANNADVVIIDTAGRLHNKIGLMNELTKIKNVMAKVVPDAPHEVLLVLDGSTGQNAFEQAKQFTAATEVNELAITKLDGTAKGGVVIGISDQFKIPVKYIGLGEGIDDLQVFRRRAFVDSLFGD